MRRIVVILITFHGAISASFSPDIKIGIIGAGPAGLTAAGRLLDLGYKNVVILEKEREIGGKVNTFFHNKKPYEMGAVVVAPPYAATVLGIADELGAKLHATPQSFACSAADKTGSIFKWSEERYGWCRIPKLIKAFSKFSYYVWRHSDFFKPGFDNTPPEMSTTFQNFMVKQGMEAVLEMYRPLMVGCGYGFAEDMPAAYWMKLMAVFAHEYNKHILDPRPFYQSFDDGWQTLWQKFAERKEIDIRLDSNATRIIRRREKGERAISVLTDNGEFEFDKLIVTVPHLIKQFMDLDLEEEEVFSKVRTLSYRVTLAQIEGLPRKAHLWIRENSYKYDDNGNENDGKPVLISSNYDTDIYQIYQFTSTGKNGAFLDELMYETVDSLGAVILNVIHEKVFDYFPHFDAESFAMGTHAKLTDLQGKDGVYYAGSLVNFETVEHSALQAEGLIKKFFQ